MSNKVLNPKQKRFCEEYVKDLNGTQAAIRAGYSKKTAKEQASHLLTKINIQQYIKELQEKIQKENWLTVDYITSGLKEVFERCKEGYPVFDKDGNVVSIKMDSAGANRAAELLGKHIGMFVDQKVLTIKKKYTDEDIDKLLEAEEDD